MIVIQANLTWNKQAVHGGALGLLVLELLIVAPARYPDIFAVLNVLVCTPVFGLAWLWSIKCSMEVGWALGGPGPVAEKKTG